MKNLFPCTISSFFARAQAQLAANFLHRKHEYSDEPSDKTHAREGIDENDKRSNLLLHQKEGAL